MRHFLALTSLALLYLAATPAWAHAHLQSSVPASGATLTTSPKLLELHFSEGVDPGASHASVTGSNGEAMQTGAPFTGAETADLNVPLIGTLQPGSYTVSWQALAEDGHKSTGQYSFSVGP